jgi:acyl-CoA dehydrogenase
MDKRLFDLPFFDAHHRDFANTLYDWAYANLRSRIHDQSVDQSCRALVDLLGQAGWLRYCVPAHAGGALAALDSRSLCLARQILAYFDGLADFSFAMQGLGSGAISLFGSPEQQQTYLPDVARGKKIAAFALSEPEAGSDAAALSTTATRQTNHYRLNGVKTWISNAGIAEFYVVFAQTQGDTSDGVSAFIVDANTPGLEISERFDVIAPHPIGTLTFKDCTIACEQRLADAGKGFKVALQTLDVFRASVGAAALGFAQAAADMGTRYAGQRRMFGLTLGEMQLTQAAVGEMYTDIDAAALLVYRAAWQRDVLGQRTTSEAAMAKLFATEAAQKIVDRNVQLHGGLGVKVGHPAELLYREVRALRIYEGASEIQKLIVARETIRHMTQGDPT